MSHPWAPARIDTPMAAQPAMASITVVMAVARCDPLSVRVSSFMVKPPSHAGALNSNRQRSWRWYQVARAPGSPSSFVRSFP